jgi:hypothetical protein
MGGSRCRCRVRPARLRALEPLIAERLHDGLEPRVHAQFVQKKADVVSGGFFGDQQGLGDLGRREAMCEQAEYLVLPRRQTLAPV